MTTFKNILLAMFGGACVGYAIASLLVRGFLPWYNTPAGASQALCNLGDVVRATVGTLIEMQLLGMGIGALAALVLTLVLGRRKKQTPAAQTPPTSQPLP